jgi:uncharacterized membrane protein (UPF0127 family)
MQSQVKIVMRSAHIGSIFGLSLILLLGCSMAPAAKLNDPPQKLAEAAAPTAAPTVQENLAQMLPITAEAEFASQVIQLEVASTPDQQEKGLMYRPALPDNRGMLFPFNPPRPVRFWMENTPEPLDIVFLLNGQVKAVVANAPPCTRQPCPTYGPGTDVDQVIELRSGRAAELGLKVGDRMTVRFLASK